MKSRLLSVVFVIAFLFLFYPVKSYDSVPLMSLEEIQSLLEKGPIDAHFESVPRGTKLQRYNIQIRGIYDEVGLKLILFTTRHVIVAGMSGSPVYVNGKLVGAMGYSFNQLNFNYPSWGGIAPISLMIQESNTAKSSRTVLAAVKRFFYRGMEFRPIPTGIDSLPELKESSFSISSGSVLSVDSRPVLKAGMPIVVDLIEFQDDKGEVSTVSAMGTITYVDDKGRIYAFGHPFLDAKKVVYSFRACEIMGTVYSHLNSYKLGDKKSAILGTIDLDSTYGIYGDISLVKLSRLKRFSLELKREGWSYKNFDIKVADSEFAPMLANYALSLIGSANGAPMPEESAVTELQSTVSLKGFDPIVTSELYSSAKAVVGLQIMRQSSYETALRGFFDSLYSVLLRSPYGFEVEKVNISVNFIPGEIKKLKMGAYKFPNKVKWGEDPVLDILLVSEDNSIAVEKRLRVKVDWNQVEAPVYDQDTKETDKQSEKVVSGFIRIYSAENRPFIMESLGQNPMYFLNAKDFLDFFSREIKMGNQKLFYSVGLTAKSGLFEKRVAESGDVVTPEAERANGWNIIKGGVTDRKNTVQNLGNTFFHWEFPSMPSGYIATHLSIQIYFEVVR